VAYSAAGRQHTTFTGPDLVPVLHRHEVLTHHKGKRLLRRGYLVADPEVLRLIEQNEEVRRNWPPHLSGAKPSPLHQRMSRWHTQAGCALHAMQRCIRYTSLLACHDLSGPTSHHRLPQIAKTAFPKFKPMLVPPAPWRSANTGAHLTMRSFVMRMGEQQANRRLLEAADRDMAVGKLGASQVL
jgi:DNA-directed RNA polymerase N-terminal